MKEESLIQSRVGEQFGNYRLIQLLGVGGYAEVYLAEHIHLPNLQHAIKILTGAHLKDEKRDEFLVEAQTISKLQLLNPHIVQIKDFGVQPDPQGANGGTPYLVMEYAREKTLRHIYPRGTPVLLERILFYTQQIAEALQCVHDQTPKIVHRDIKPENILLRSLDHALLSDFGIAITGATSSQGVGRAKGLIGTATYMAPERLQGQTRRASDQYSLGIMVYEWLRGEPPFKGTDSEILVQHLKDQPPDLFPTCPHVTPEIEAVVIRTLDKDPEARYPSVQAFANALEKAVQAALQPKPPALSPLIASLPQSVQQPAVFGPGGFQVPSMYTGTTQMARQVMQAASPAIPVPKLPSLKRKPRLSIGQRVGRVFELSPHFASDRRYRFFRFNGILLNILSAVALGFLLQNPFAAVWGLLYSVLLFSLCIRAINPILARFAGTLVALYWGAVGWVLGGYLVPWFQLQLNPAYSSLSLCIIFCCVSFGLHVWYVTNKYF